jgi:4-hydroxy-3-methylbut-2-enyl diphosphate reductase
MHIILANPHGFCAGVVMAIETLERVLEMHGAPVYVYHEIVHNTHVVDQFRNRGVIFVDEVEEVPVGSCLLYSAHGVSPDVRSKARARRLQTIDATCPLVAKVHVEAVKFAAHGDTIILIGHSGHDEAVGTIGQAPDQIILVESEKDVDELSVSDPSRVAYITQTTLSIDDASRIIARLKQRFPQIVGPSKQDICFATQNRQEAVKTLLPEADVVLVLGSQNSSNSNRLAEIARDAKKPAYLIDSVQQIQSSWFEGTETVLLTAGASAPEYIVDDCVAFLQESFGATLEQQEYREESTQFPLPIAATNFDYSSAAGR